MSGNEKSEVKGGVYGLKVWNPEIHHVLRPATCQPQLTNKIKTTQKINLCFLRRVLRRRGKTTLRRSGTSKPHDGF
jgi:hypothetical protein